MDGYYYCSFMMVLTRVSHVLGLVGHLPSALMTPPLKYVAPYSDSYDSAIFLADFLTPELTF